jgi:beta-phosphoglucomutase-like phosphatase (HAD superfamily)
VQAACAAGMSVVGINSQYVADGGLSDADIVIDDYADLDPLVERWTTQ